MRLDFCHDAAVAFPLVMRTQFSEAPLDRRLLRRVRGEPAEVVVDEALVLIEFVWVGVGQCLSLDGGHDAGHERAVQEQPERSDALIGKRIVWSTAVPSSVRIEKVRQDVGIEGEGSRLRCAPPLAARLARERVVALDDLDRLMTRRAHEPGAFRSRHRTPCLARPPRRSAARSVPHPCRPAFCPLPPKAARFLRPASGPTRPTLPSLLRER